MDIIFIHDLRVQTIIGIYDWEREVKQTIAVDLEMATDIRKAASSENIEDTLNYKGVSKRLQTFIKESNFQLIETMAEEIAQILREEFHVPWVKVTLHKPGALRGTKDVGIIIERGEKNA